MDVYIKLHQVCATIKNDDVTPIQVCRSLPQGKDRDGDTILKLFIDNPDDYDLSIGKDGVTVNTVKALQNASRLDTEDSPATDAETYMQRGRDIAMSIHFGGAVEYMAAWLNEDRKQGNICHDIDAVMGLDILPKLPQWVRLDLFSILESEAMKQVFATRFVEEAKRESYHVPSDLKQDIVKSSEGETSVYISEMMADLMAKPVRYNGSAKKFDDAVQGRIALFKETLS